MKKKVLSFLLAVMMLVTMLPTTAFAMGTEMSNEFKSYLNEEGKLEVTYTSTNPNKEEFIREYVWSTGSYRTYESYYFNVNWYNAESNICSLSRIDANTGEEYEIHEVEVVYEEAISDRFAEALTNGKIILPSTSENMDVEWINSYLSSLGNDDYNFQLATYYVPPVNEGEYGDYKPLINADLTEATVMCYEHESGAKECHIVQFERITEKSANYKSYLNADGKLEINAVVPEDEWDFITICELFLWEEGIGWGYIAEDFMSVDFSVDKETHTVDIVYNYDEEVQEKLQGLVENFPEDKEFFKVEDMELINYWVNTVNSDWDIYNAMAGYSGEMKEYLGNYNVELVVDNRAGWGEPFITELIGMAAITHDDIVYYTDDMLGSHADHIIYVPDNTGDSKEELIAAVQKRIDEYLGAGNNVKVSYAGTAKEAWIDASYEMTRHWWEEEDPDLTKEEWAMGWMPAYEDFGADVLYIEGVDEDDPTLLVTITSGDVTETHNVIVRKDSSKMITPTYATADMKNDIEISSTSSAIPLDTAIQSEKLTSGTEYDKIIEVLDVKENETYDISLYSNSLQSNITKLENGTFEVKIPVSDTLKNKDLVAYYVDEDDKVVEYEVTVKDDCAVFATDHFSIYTIAERKDNTGEGPATSVPEVVAPENNVGGSTFEEKAKDVVEKVPFTAEEKAQIEAGAEVTITLEVKDISETVSKEEKAKVEAEVKEVKDQKVGMYLDVNMFKKVGNNTAVKIPELNGKVKIQFTVPDELLVKDTTKNREYSIIRIHDGETTVLDAKFDATTKTLVFETDSFSTYALVYKDVAKVPQTGDNTSVMVWVMLLAVGGCAVAYGTKKKVVR